MRSVGLQPLFQLRNAADGPLMISGDIVERRDRGESLRQHLRVSLTGNPVQVLQVTQIEDIVGGDRRHGGEEVRVSLSEFRAVEIAEHRQAAAVKAVGQAGQARREAGGFQRRVIPADKQHRQSGQDRQSRQRPQRAAFMRAVCHSRGRLL